MSETPEHNEQDNDNLEPQEDVTNEVAEDDDSGDATDSTSESESSSDLAVEVQLDDVERRLAKRARRMTISNIALVTVGVVMAIALSLAFNFVHGQIEFLEDPKKVVTLARGQLNSVGAPTSLSDAVSFVEKEIEVNAPAVAADISKRALEWAPDVRLTIQEYAVEQMTALVNEGTAFTADKFDEMVEENRETIESALRDLADNEQLSKDTIDSLVGILEGEIGADLEAQVAVILSTLQDLNNKLEKLTAGSGLNAEEQVEREFLMIARRILADEADPDNSANVRENQQPLRIIAPKETQDAEPEEAAAETSEDE